jgi:hypothetical protein
MKIYGQWLYRSMFSLFWVLFGSEWSGWRLGSFRLSERALLPLKRRLGGPQNWSRRFGEMKILDATSTLNSDISVVQPVASRYTDCAASAPLWSCMVLKWRERIGGCGPMCYRNQRDPKTRWMLTITGYAWRQVKKHKLLEIRSYVKKEN